MLVITRGYPGYSRIISACGVLFGTICHEQSQACQAQIFTLWMLNWVGLSWLMLAGSTSNEQGHLIAILNYQRVHHHFPLVFPWIFPIFRCQVLSISHFSAVSHHLEPQTPSSAPKPSLGQEIAEGLGFRWVKFRVEKLLKFQSWCSHPED